MAYWGSCLMIFFCSSRPRCSSGSPSAGRALDDQVQLGIGNSVHTVSDLFSLKAVSFVCQDVAFVTRRNLLHWVCLALEESPYSRVFENEQMPSINYVDSIFLTTVVRRPWRKPGYVGMSLFNQLREEQSVWG